MPQKSYDVLRMSCAAAFWRQRQSPPTTTADFIKILLSPYKSSRSSRSPLSCCLCLSITMQSFQTKPAASSLHENSSALPSQKLQAARESLLIASLMTSSRPPASRFIRAKSTYPPCAALMVLPTFMFVLLSERVPCFFLDSKKLGCCKNL